MTLPTFSQEGRVALVTGGRRGIGRAIALAFADAGADVVVADIVADDGLLEATAKDIEDRGRRALAIVTDVTDRSAVEAMTEKAVNAFGQIDILVNNAGIVGGVPAHHAFGDGDDDFYGIYNVTVKGTALCTAAVAPHMVERKTGCIINMSSMGAYLKRGGGAYTLAKSAIIDITSGIATEYGPHGIRANAIAPGVIRSDMTQVFLKFPQIVGFYEEMTPLGRLGEPEDIANTALMLASDAAGFITGQTILVDGGLTPVDLRNLPDR
jgi:NAD(P)-dependent dehydrogenase (short-subunit alcohol dehydrogenase family)